MLRTEIHLLSAEPVQGPGKTYRLLGPDRIPYTSTQPGMHGGNTSTKIYGRLDCPTALRAIARGGYVANRVFFADEATAVSAGHRPCGVCCKPEYAAWKRAEGSVLTNESDGADP